MTDKQMWEKYTQINPLAENYEAWAFGGNSPEMPNILAELVLTKEKTATASAFPCYEFEKSPLPAVGQYNIILNTNNEAICIIQTTNVYVTPFKAVTEEHAYKEGEDDKSLNFWRQCHSEIFSMELKSIGQQFDHEMPVVCEEFKVVYPVE